MLPSFIPNEMELKAFKNYERSGKSFEELADEDKFMWLVSKIAFDNLFHVGERF